jgi:dTDP-4-amino-4,6-dideoxygalactose transaminase
MQVQFPEPLHVGKPNMGSRLEFDRLVDGIFERRLLSNAGPLVEEFEQRVATFLGVRNCVSMVNGTVALEIAIRALGLTGEVIVPSYTFIATAHALHWQGLTPVFADIDARTHNLDPDSVRSAITQRTSGIIGVHLWGRPAPIAELQSVADEHGLTLLFDAAHAFGNSYEGQMIGNFGRAEVLSFHATKFFNTFEGGAVVTNDDALADQMRLMRNFGFSGFDEVVYPGTNGKMTEICAAMGLVNLGSIDSFAARNQENYAAYAAAFAGSEQLSLLTYESAMDGNHQYVILELAPRAVKYRDRLVTDLHSENIRARRYFWPGCHMMEPYRTLFPDAGLLLANTTTVADRVIVLPTGMSVNPRDCIQIADYILARLSCY